MTDHAPRHDLPLHRLTSGRRAYENLKEAAADFIRDAIVEGHLAPGAKIDQDAIASALGVSRVPVREALIELAQKGFVVAVPRRGAFVAEVAVEDIEDHYDVVAMVLALAAKRAVRKLSPAQLDQLRTLDAEILAASDPIVRRELDRQFMNVIARTGSSARLDSILHFLGGALPGSFYYAAPASDASEAAYRKRMLKALAARDAKGASKISEQHLHACARIAIDHLRAQGYWGGDAADAG